MCTGSQVDQDHRLGEIIRECVRQLAQNLLVWLIENQMRAPMTSRSIANSIDRIGRDVVINY
jgi:hypothetical protein